MSTKKAERKSFNVPLPESSGISTIKIPFSALDERGTIGNGTMSIMENVDVSHFPYIVPMKSINIVDILTNYSGVESILEVVGDRNGELFICGKVGFTNPEDAKIILYTDDIINVDPVQTFSAETQGTLPQTSRYNNDYISPETKHKSNNVICVSIMSNLTNLVETSFNNYLYIYDYRTKIAFTFNEPDSDSFQYLMAITSSLVPTTEPIIKSCCFCHSRIFGTDGKRIFVSNYNVAGWTLDTATSYNSANAWMSLVTSSDESEFHTLIALNGTVFCFKDQEIYEIRNNKNPFRIQLISNLNSYSGSVVAIDNVMYFCGKDNVYAFNGSSFSIVSQQINFDKLIYNNNTYTNTEVYDNCKLLSCYGNGKYYIMIFRKKSGTATNEVRKYFMYLYNTELKSWTTLYSDSFNNLDKEINGSLYSDYKFIVGNSKNAFYTANKKAITGIAEKNLTLTGVLDWAFCTGLNYNVMGVKKIHKIQVMCDIQDGASVEIYLLKENEEFNSITSKNVYSYTHSGTLQQKLISIVPNVKTSCKTYRLYFKCSGYIKFYNMELQISKGGDVVNG